MTLCFPIHLAFSWSLLCWWNCYFHQWHFRFIVTLANICQRMVVVDGQNEQTKYYFSIVSIFSHIHLCIFFGFLWFSSPFRLILSFLFRHSSFSVNLRHQLPYDDFVENHWKNSHTFCVCLACRCWKAILLKLTDASSFLHQDANSSTTKNPNDECMKLHLMACYTQKHSAPFHPSFCFSTIIFFSLLPRCSSFPMQMQVDIVIYVLLLCKICSLRIHRFATSRIFIFVSSFHSS